MAFLVTDGTSSDKLLNDCVIDMVWDSDQIKAAGVLPRFPWPIGHP
jgi:hypothetical protein